MRDKALAAIARYAMLASGEAVTVAFSGGADSTALLHFLAMHAPMLGITVRAAHVNHNLRGEESARDERFVREFCAALGVELEVLVLHRVAGAAKAAGQGVEEYARGARYAFFAQLRQRWGGKTATAHTLSDSLETTLFHLARGTGLRGLRGIPPVRDGIVRPLIGCTRAEVEAYCAGNGLFYCVDATNAGDDFSRNRIRNAVLPALRTAHPGLEASYARLRIQLEDDVDFLEREAERALAACTRPAGCDAAALLALHPALRFRVLALLARRMGAELDGAKGALLLSHLGDAHFALELAAGRVLELRNGILAPRKVEQAPEPGYEIPVREGTFCAGNVFSVTLRIINDENSELLEKITEKRLNNCLDYDRIQNELFLRPRRPGDFVRLQGRGVTKSLKKLYQEAGVAAQLRGSLPVLADAGGVVWVHGFGCAERVAVRQSTKRVLLVCVTEGETGAE